MDHTIPGRSTSRIETRETKGRRVRTRSQESVSSEERGNPAPQLLLIDYRLPNFRLSFSLLPGHRFLREADDDEDDDDD